VSAGLVEERKIRKAVRFHSEKIERFIHIILSHSIFALHADEIEKALEHDREESDHARHIYPSVMEKVCADGVRWGPTIASLFARANETKLNALYVDIVSNKAVLPAVVVGRELYEHISRFLNLFLPGFEIILDEDDATFGRVAAQIDPDFRYVLKP
jgi:hypothetical protein